MLAQEESVFCELAAVVALADELEAATSDFIDPQSKVVCLMTGSGFNDEVSVARINRDRTRLLIDKDQLVNILEGG